MRMTIRNSLIIASVLISLASCVGFVSLSYLVSSRASYSQIRAKTASAASRIALALSQSLWQYDLEGASLIMRSELADRDIDALALRDSDGKLLVAIGRSRDKMVLMGNSPVRELSEGDMAAVFASSFAVTPAAIIHSGLSLGSIVIYSTDDALKAELRSRIPGLLGISLLIGGLVGIAIFLIFHSFVSSRLRELGNAIGLIAKGDFAARAEVSRDDEIGDLALAFNSMASELSELYGELQTSETSLRASLHEKEILLKEIHHRVKNNLQIIASLLTIQAGRMQDSEARRLSEGSVSRIDAMAQVHELLYESSDFSSIDFAEYARNVAGNLYSAFRNGESDIRLAIEAESIELPIDQAIPCGLLFNELLSNAFAHAFSPSPGRTGTISITLRRAEGELIELVVADDGKGLPEGLDPEAAQSIGLSLVILLAKQLGGEMRFESQGGLKARLVFPRARA